MSPTLAQLDLFGGPPTPVAAAGSHGVAPALAAESLTKLAAELPRSLYLGTSSWSFPGWAGVVYEKTYSQERLARGGLKAYAQHPLLRSVGIDRSYYAPLRRDELERYAAAVPRDFRFLMKAHESLTQAHYPRHARYGARRGRPSESFLEPGYATLAVVDPFVQTMGERAGPILFQFPPQHIGAFGGPRLFAERLHRFLRALPRGPLYAIELRNAELLCPEYRDALTDVGACHCINVYPKMPPPAVQYQRAGVDRAPALVVRWMLQPRLGYEQAKALFEPFDRLVEEDTFHRKEIADLVAGACRTAQPSFVIANNKAEGSSPQTLARLAREIGKRTSCPRSTDVPT
ncbi:MAG TPA: DUF72 domain-containing protein [Nannocystis exedens]|nr:DUF72 domain-containing protein [Nannocystis exedens]